MNPAILMLVLRILLALLLYAFLAALLIFLWRDFRREDDPGESAPDAHLRVVAGPDPGKVCSLGIENTIGRSAENDVSMPDETVSARHAKISYRKGLWWLEDLGSRNGTLLNQAVVERPAVLSTGDRIDVGQVQLVFESGPNDTDEVRSIDSF
jgi:hypothetical protein